jgi:hypothetical protein
MTIIRYTPALRIANTDQLPGGTGAKYLEAMLGHDGELIAVAWRRKKPASLDHGRVLVRFGK